MYDAKVSHEIIYMLLLCFSLGKTILFGALHLINCEMLPLKGITHTHTNTQSRLLLPKDKTMQGGQMIVVCVCMRL